MQPDKQRAQHSLDTKDKRKSLVNELAKNEGFAAEMVEAIDDVEQGNYDTYTYDELTELVTVDRAARTVTDKRNVRNPGEAGAR